MTFKPTMPDVLGRRAGIRFANEMLGEAFKQHLTQLPDPSYKRVFKLPVVNDCDIDLYRSLPKPVQRIDKATDQLDDPARDTRAQLYQDKTWNWGARFNVGWSYELARFVCSPDQSGIVKLCWTSVIADDGAGGIKLWDPQDPFAHWRAGAQIRWHLRLYQGTFQPIGPVWSGPVLEMPGQAFPPLHRWTDLRFLWGRTQAMVFHLIPANFALRLFAEVVMDTDLLELGGRLVGYTQPIDTKPAGYNARYGW